MNVNTCVCTNLDDSQALAIYYSIFVHVSDNMICSQNYILHVIQLLLFVLDLMQNWKENIFSHMWYLTLMMTYWWVFLMVPIMPPQSLTCARKLLIMIATVNLITTLNPLCSLTMVLSGWELLAQLGTPLTALYLHMILPALPFNGR